MPIYRKNASDDLMNFVLVLCRGWMMLGRVLWQAASRWRRGGPCDSLSGRLPFARELSCLVALGAAGLALIPTAASAQSKPLNLKAPDASVVLMGADCHLTCGLSGFFAPAIWQNSVAGLPLTNLANQAVVVNAQFYGTNGLGLNRLGGHLMLAKSVGLSQENLLGDPAPGFRLEPGETVNLTLFLRPGLPPGSYAGELRFVATASADAADPVSKTVPVNAKVRTSVVWVIMVVLLGILIGRLAQLVYDPKLITRVEVLDWLSEIEDKIGDVDPKLRQQFQERLVRLRKRLFARNVDATALKTEVQQLDEDVDAAAAPRVEADIARTQIGGGPVLSPAKRRNSGYFGRALRVLAGVTPLRLPTVHDWLLPVFVLLTLAALTITFVIQQYGSGGTAETFGAGGIADFAGLFLAGVASEAIASGLRSVKLR